MKKTNIEIHPVKWLYYNLPDEERTACAIIVSSYEIRLNKLDKLKSKIIFSFADIKDSNNPSSFNEEYAKEIHQYVDNLPDDADVLFVCCDSGESRSSAIAASILRYWGNDEMQIWKNYHYHPNPLVYKLLCNEFGTDVSDSDVQHRIEINENSLSETIKKAREQKI